MDGLRPVTKADSEVETSPGIVAYGRAASNHFTLTGGDERKRPGTLTTGPRMLSPRGLACQGETLPPLWGECGRNYHDAT